MTARAIDLIGARPRGAQPRRGVTAPPAADWTILRPETVTVVPHRAGSTVIKAPRKVRIQGGTMSIPPPSVFRGFWFTEPKTVIVHEADGTIKQFTAPLDAADVRGGAQGHKHVRGVGDDEESVGYSWDDFSKDALSTIAKAAGTPAAPAAPVAPIVPVVPPVAPAPPESFFERKIAGPVRVWHVGAALGGLIGIKLLTRG